MAVRALFMLAMLVVNTTPESVQTVGREIAGRVTDGLGAPIPGVRVSASGPGLLVAETTITDNDGRFVLKGPLQLPPATYTVSAQLEGFETAIVMVRASDEGGAASFTIRMRIACHEPDLEVAAELETYVRAADVVALVRLDSIQRQQQPRVGDGYCGPITMFTATILEATKNRRSQRPGSIQFVLLGQRGQFEPGDEYIAILEWHPATRAYRLTSRSYFMPVRAGQVGWPGDKKPLAELLTTLRAVSRQQ